MNEKENAPFERGAQPEHDNVILPPPPAGWSGSAIVTFLLGDCEACFRVLCELRGRLLMGERRTA